MKRLAPLACAIVALGLGACSQPKPQAAPVSVKLKLLDRSDKPLKDSVVTLTPTGTENSATRPSAPVQADGTAVVECLPGPYTATVAAIPRQGHGDPGEGALSDPGKATGGIPKKYRSAGESPWKIEVQPAGNGEFVLKAQ